MKGSRRSGVRPLPISWAPSPTKVGEPSPRCCTVFGARGESPKGALHPMSRPRLLQLMGGAVRTPPLPRGKGPARRVGRGRIPGVAIPSEYVLSARSNSPKTSDQKHLELGFESVDLVKLSRASFWGGKAHFLGVAFHASDDVVILEGDASCPGAFGAAIGVDHHGQLDLAL